MRMCGTQGVVSAVWVRFSEPPAANM